MEKRSASESNPLLVPPHGTAVRVRPEVDRHVGMREYQAGESLAVFVSVDWPFPTGFNHDDSGGRVVEMPFPCLADVVAKVPHSTRRQLNGGQ